VDRKSLDWAALLEILRIVREVEAPKPSDKLSTMNTLPSVAANRGTEPAKLSRLFVAGIAGTTWGLIRADHEAENARDRETDGKKSEEEAKKSQQTARQEKADAIAARNDLEKANKELLQSSDNLLSSVARSLLRPLAVQVRPQQPVPPLNDQEIDPLWELASSNDERLRFRFVEFAMQDAASKRRFKDRADFAFQATIGLDGARRTQAEGLLGKRLLAKEISQEEQQW
jgi:hypothetical protein